MPDANEVNQIYFECTFPYLYFLFGHLPSDSATSGGYRLIPTISNLLPPLMSSSTRRLRFLVDDGHCSEKTSERTEPIIVCSKIGIITRSVIVSVVVVSNSYKNSNTLVAPSNEPKEPPRALHGDVSEPELE